jgi:hypothetical protein
MPVEQNAVKGLQVGAASHLHFPCSDTCQQLQQPCQILSQSVSLYTTRIRRKSWPKPKSIRFVRGKLPQKAASTVSQQLRGQMAPVFGATSSFGWVPQPLLGQLMLRGGCAAPPPPLHGRTSSQLVNFGSFWRAIQTTTSQRQAKTVARADHSLNTIDGKNWDQGRGRRPFATG